MAQSVIVPKDIFKECSVLISGKAVGGVQKGVELLLKNNLYIEGGSNDVRSDQVDASQILATGLATLSKSPFEMLGVPVGAKTQDIRKAYKKMALKYHVSYTRQYV